MIIRSCTALYLHFSSYFNTLIIVLVPGIRTRDLPLHSQALFRLSNPASVLQFSSQILSLLLNTTVTYPYLHVTFWMWFFTVCTLDYPPLTCKRNMVLQIFPFQCNGAILVGAGNNFKLATIDVILLGTIKNKVFRN